MSSTPLDTPLPPKAAMWLLRRCIPLPVQDDLLDDLDAVFEHRVQKTDLRRARRRYWYDVLSICARRSIWTSTPAPASFPYETARGPIMLTNYFKTALRILRKQKGYAFLNVTGLAVGLACCILLFNLVLNELSYDTFHQNLGRIHRVILTLNGSQGFATPAPLGPVIEEAFPEIANTVRFIDWSAVVHKDEESFNETVLFTDPAFLSMFTFPLVQGDPAQALSAPDRVVLSQAMATKYFGEADPLNQSLTINLGGTTLTYTVSGVASEPPDNSSLQFDFLLPFEKLALVLGEDVLQDWESFDSNTFVFLHDADQAAQVQNKFAAFVTEQFGAMLQEAGLGPDDFAISLQPYDAYHLGAIRGGNGLSSRGNPKTLSILMGIALVILLIACFNFMNLTLGRSAVRFKEVGVRKILGARRGQLIKQFLFEALFLSFIAILLAMGLALLFRPTFNAMTGTTASLDYLANGWLLVAIATLMTFISLTVGGYPALVLSRFRPVEIFKGKLKIGGKNFFTKTLITVQFTLSTTLIVCTILIAQQLRYVTEKPLGFDNDAVVVLSTGASSVNMEQGERTLNYYKAKLAGHPNVLNVTAASTSFGRGLASTDVRQEDRSVEVFHYKVDVDFVDTFNITLQSGRTFTEEHGSDATASVVVNEAFVRAFGLEVPVGHVFTDFTSSIIPSNPTIIGVVKDYHFQSMRTEIAPMVLHMSPKAPYRGLLVKISPTDVAGTLADLEALWKDINPDAPYAAWFLDDDLDRQYRTEQRWKRIVTYSSLLAVLIACLGLFGLSAFTAERRSKEIGVRKVLGASVPSIIIMLSKEFGLLILLAFVLAAPIGYQVMNQWLQAFVYRIDLGPGPFLLGGALTLGIALLSVSYQSIRAALKDPVESLRYE